MILPSTGMRAFVDATDCATWMKFVRSVEDDVEAVNLRVTLISGQVSFPSNSRST